jgi:hypothetical protein
MRINPLSLGKADHRLRDVLASATGSEELRVLLTLRPAEEFFDAPPAPSDFPTREDYRRALIERRQRQVAASIGDTVRALSALGVRVIGETVLSTVIADATAAQFAAALAVPGVERAVLDRPLELIRTVSVGNSNRGS